MATKIEKLKERLQKAEEELDVKKLKDVAKHIQMAKIILVKHIFRSHRLEIAERLEFSLIDVLQLITEIQLKKEDGSVDKAVM